MSGFVHVESHMVLLFHDKCNLIYLIQFVHYQFMGLVLHWLQVGKNLTHEVFVLWIFPGIPCLLDVFIIFLHELEFPLVVV